MFLDIIRKRLPELVSILLFLSLIPLYSYINFYQNDDWNRNTSLLRFLGGDFSLLEVTATTFYSQAILGLIWSALLDVRNLPLLTLLISVANFYLFWKILQIKNVSNDLFRFFASLVFFTNPIHIYSSIGFMTENYVIFYLLLGLFFFYKYELQSKNYFLYLSGLFGFLAFYSKQSALVFLVGFAFYFFVIKKWKEFKVFTFFTSFCLLTYYFLFPRTSEMREKDFSFLNLNLDYIFSLNYGIFIYLIYFSIPFVLLFIYKFIKNYSLPKYFLFFLTSLTIYFSLNYFFKPGLISWEEFPYFENTFERTGFLPRTIDGTKYQFRFNYDLYYYLDLISKVLLAMFTSVLILNFKKIKSYQNPLVYVILVNLGLLVFVSIFFDRYILTLVPFFILSLIFSNTSFKISYLLLIPFCLFQSYFSYFLASDFIYSHNYIWSKSSEIVEKTEVSPAQIDATGAWNRSYKTTSPIFIFSYDSPQVNSVFKNSYELIETKEIKFVGNLFINPKIYLYKLK